MWIKQDMDFNDLEKFCWSGACPTLQFISDNNKEDEFMSYLEAEFSNDIPADLTDVNDFLWRYSDVIFNDLGINNDISPEDLDNFIK